MPVREIIAAICIIIGLFVFLCGTFGVFRLKYVLNKMHAAALGDTMGLFFIVLGLIILIRPDHSVLLADQPYCNSYAGKGRTFDQ